MEENRAIRVVVAIAIGIPITIPISITVVKFVANK
jgi:hypothetical protein